MCGHIQMITSRIRLHSIPGVFRLPAVYRRSLSCSPLAKAKQMPPRPSVDEDEIVEVFLKGSGPGGQKINKTASAVQLKHLPTGLVVKSQATRSREQNRKIARNILALKLEERLKGDDSRAAKLREKSSKKKASKTKKAKRKYAKLEAKKTATTGEQTKHDFDDEKGDILGPGAGSDLGHLNLVNGITEAPKDLKAPLCEHSRPS